MNHQFDELAKDLARGVSRREALRRFGSGAASALLASMGLGRAWGAPGGNGNGGGGNSACAHFCSAVFPEGPLRDACVSEAAQGIGLCPQCNADVIHVCGTSLASLTCCANTAVSICCSGACVNTLTDINNCGGCNQPCGADQTCVNGTCVCTNGQCGGSCLPAGSFCCAGMTACPASDACVVSGGGAPGTGDWVCCIPDLGCAPDGTGAGCCSGFALPTALGCPSGYICESRVFLNPSCGEDGSPCTVAGDCCTGCCDPTTHVCVEALPSAVCSPS